MLDLRGDLSKIVYGGGQQTFMAKLRQFVTSSPATPLQATKPALPVDRALGFAKAAHQQINGALVRCEERFPQQGAHSVLCIVVESNAPQWQERLAPLHNEYFGQNSDPLTPVRLEVIDRATDAALERLQAAGLIVNGSRATRPLLPVPGGGAPIPVAPEEREKAIAFRSQASRKLKMARVLAGTDLRDEARVALMDAALQLGRALAVENRLPEPARLEEALLPSFSFCWKDALPVVRRLNEDTRIECDTAADVLTKI